MKTNRILFGMLGIAAGLSAAAAPLTPQEALQRVRQNSGQTKIAARVSVDVKPVFTAHTEVGTPAAYVFNATDKGYMILSADDVAYPILGYSDNGKIDVDNMSPELIWWLNEYARQIEWASSHGASPANAPAYVDGREAILPLMKTKWNQDAPFNDACPMSNNQRTYTGCVATSMAQVMNYHKYPQVGEGLITYYCNSLRRNLTLNFTREEFDWNNMLDVYLSGQYNEAQAEAVAYLMKACGYAVEMNYGLDASGASGAAISRGLKQYLKYDEGTRSEYRMLYSSSQWDKMMYDNLKNIGPVIINGQSPTEGGHSFVCDGYDGKGYYHINWGWGGMSDGYYLLEALNPEAQGIGGFAGGFNFSQNGIFGIQPPTGRPYETVQGMIQYGSTIGTISGKNLSLDTSDYSPLGWTSSTGDPYKANVGVIIEPIDGTSGDVKYVQGKFGDYSSIEFSGNYSYFTNSNKMNFTLPSLSNGKYKVTLASKEAENSSATWVPCLVPWGMVNYVDLTVNGESYTVNNVPAKTAAISNLEVISPVYNKSNVHLKVKASNPSDIELTQGICPKLRDSNGKIVFTGESVLLSLNPGETLEFAWSCRFQAMSGAPDIKGDTDMTLVLENPTTHQLYPGIEIPVVMHKAVTSTMIMASDVMIEDTDKGQITINGRKFMNVYFLKSFAEPFNVKFNIDCTRGYADGIITASISAPDPQDQSIVYPVVDELFKAQPFLQASESESYELPITFTEGESMKIYYLNIAYTSGANSRNLTRLSFIVTPAGVDEVFDDQEGEIEYYNLQGLRIYNPIKDQIVIARQGDKIRKIVIK